MSKKKVVLLVLIGISIAIVSLYATYAINVTVEEGTPTTYDMAFSFDLSEGLLNQLTVEAGKTKLFDIDITNPYSDSVQYGIGYSLVSPTTLPEGVIIAESSLSSDPAVGLVEAYDTVSVSLVIVNESTTDVTIELSVINGYKNGGDLIIGDKTLIEEVYDVVPPSVATLIKLGLNDLVQTGIPDFATVATTDEGIYAAEDDLGISYYFRGASENNYVKFGKNSSGSDMYWRIIRINGDGTVRLIYDGTQAYDNGTSSTDRRVTTLNWHELPRDDNVYVGYMMGATGASTYAETHANTNNSPIKTFLEGEPTSTNTGWYYENILATGYEEYIADAIYCNDRSVNNKLTMGFGQTVTYYGAYYRLRYDIANANPVLTCSQPNDRFTYESENFEIETNGKLGYPVGLITADEVVMAGGPMLSSPYNTSYYLYNSAWLWTMTPFGLTDDVVSTVFIIYYTGNLDASATNASAEVRPVLSLKSDALQYSETSNGTKDYPFVVE